MVNGRTVLSSGEVCAFLLPPFQGPRLPPETQLLSRLLLWADKGGSLLVTVIPSLG